MVRRYSPRRKTKDLSKTQGFSQRLCKTGSSDRSRRSVRVGIQSITTQNHRSFTTAKTSVLAVRPNCVRMDAEGKTYMSDVRENSQSRSQASPGATRRMSSLRRVLVLALAAMVGWKAAPRALTADNADSTAPLKTTERIASVSMPALATNQPGYTAPAAPAPDLNATSPIEVIELPPATKRDEGGAKQPHEARVAPDASHEQTPGRKDEPALAKKPLIGTPELTTHPGPHVAPPPPGALGMVPPREGEPLRLTPAPQQPNPPPRPPEIYRSPPSLPPILVLPFGLLARQFVAHGSGGAVHGSSAPVHSGRH